MIGGFLGAGKTTSILQLAQRLQAQSQRVGLITNDQSTGLVDTAMLASHGFATEEIPGGCFCCKFNSLIEAAEKLTGDSQPDVFIAEPVGSCTDLRSTVSYPLQRMYGDNYTIAPLSVVADPIRAQRVLGLKEGKQFSAKVVYIYEKQLEEADIIVLNKTDLVTPAELDELEAAIDQRWPQARVMRVCARSGEGIDAWLEAILASDLPGGAAMEVDYDLYAEGEALLGWLNLSADLSGEEFNGNQYLLDLAEHLVAKLGADIVDIAHLKMTLLPDEGPDLAVANLVRVGSSPELSHRLADPLSAGELLLNLRAEGDPDTLREGVEQSLREVSASHRIEAILRDVSAFRPGRPVPVHRLEDV
jgi:Ni2+-binding GTPase involved in maturation of urease and hydrogenase